MIKTRIAAAGIVVGIAASMLSASAAHALPKDGVGCTLNPSICEPEEEPTTPTTPPKPPFDKCQIVVCGGTGGVKDPGPEPKRPICEIVVCPEQPPVLDPGTNDPTPTTPPTPDPEPSPTTPTPQPTPTAPTQPTGDTGSGNGGGQTVKPVRTVRTPAQAEQVAQPIDAGPVAASDQAVGYAPQSQSNEQGLSSFAKLFIFSILGGAAFGLLMWMMGRKRNA